MRSPIRPRFDTTFLYKPNAYASIRARGQMRLYKQAWYTHVKEIALRLAGRDDELVLIAGTFGTKRRQTEATAALSDVCAQVDRNIKLCIWESATSWGLQVADYGLWATHRDLRGRSCPWFEPCVRPTLETTYTPWGTQPVTPPLAGT